MLIALCVAFKQLVPEHVISLFRGALSIRVKVCLEIKLYMFLAVISISPVCS